MLLPEYYIVKETPTELKRIKVTKENTYYWLNGIVTDPTGPLSSYKKK